MPDIRREKLRGLNPPGSHAGLALSKLLETHDDPYGGFVGKLASTTVSEIYRTAFERWKNALKEAVFIEATTTGPLAIGLGNASPIENGLAIHHTYGTPYLPGSALKGLMRRAADRYGLSDREKEVLFGTTNQAAHLVYWDGWLNPESNPPYQKDVITVHHQSYYGSGGKDWPTDFDDPNPVSFLSVKPGTKFCIALSSASENSADWVVRAAEILKCGLENLGLGGKTNAGYGYFCDFKVTIPEKPKTPEEQGLDLLEQKRSTILQIKNAQDLSKADQVLAEIANLSPAVRKATLEALRNHLQSIKQWNLEKSRCQKIQALLEES